MFFKLQQQKKLGMSQLDASVNEKQVAVLVTLTVQIHFTAYFEKSQPNQPRPLCFSIWDLLTSMCKTRTTSSLNLQSLQIVYNQSAGSKYQQ